MYHFNYDLADRSIINDMMIRTLERDRKYLGELKTKDVFDKFFERQLNVLIEQRVALKNEMAKFPLTLKAEKRIDDFITEFTFLQQGREEVCRYSNIALRNRTLAALEAYLGLK